MRQGLRSPGSIAVALHDVEPATFERCALIRDWLDDQGVDRVTLLVIPAPDLHPFHDRRPEIAEWLGERAARGDAVAQHGFQHRQARRTARPRQLVAQWQGHGGAEFVGLDPGETRRAVAAGRRVLKLAGVEPRGFVAPAYAYTAALRQTLGLSFDWWAGLTRLHRGHGQRAVRAPALCAGLSSVGALMPGPLLRLDLHPSDLDRPGRIAATERVLRRARRRAAVTYDDLAIASPPS